MYTCPNCNYQTENATNFCTNCGTAMVCSEVNQPEAQSAEQIDYVAPVQAELQTVIQPPHIAKKIVGMALSIGGFSMAIIGLIYVILFTAIEGVAGFAMAIIFGIFSAPLCIVGLIMSLSNIRHGDISAFSRVGKILGIVGISITGFFLFIGLIALTRNTASLYNDSALELIY